MTDYVLRRLVPYDYPELNKSRELRLARQEFGNGLIGVLLQTKQPCIVSVEEEIIQKHGPSFWSREPDDEITLRAKITSTMNRTATVESVIYMAPKIERLTFMERLKYLFTGKYEDKSRIDHFSVKVR